MPSVLPLAVVSASFGFLFQISYDMKYFVLLRISYNTQYRLVNTWMGKFVQLYKFT